MWRVGAVLALKKIARAPSLEPGGGLVLAAALAASITFRNYFIL